MPAQAQAIGRSSSLDGGSERRSSVETAVLPIVLMLSIMGHGLVAAALALVPREMSISEPASIEFEVAIAVPSNPPPVAPTPEVIDEPVAAVPVTTARERVLPASTARRAIVEAAPQAPEVPAPASIAPLAPAAIDDVFGAPAVLHAEGAGSFAAGGVGGGGHGRGAGIGSGHASGGTGDGSAEQGPSGPSPEEIRRARRAYANRIRDLLGGAAHYPAPARRGGMEGRVIVGLRIAEDGRLLAARIASSCGFSMLDEAALTAANDLSRVPAPPTLVAWNTSDELRVPIVFELSQ